MAASHPPPSDGKPETPAAADQRPGFVTGKGMAPLTPPQQAPDDAPGTPATAKPKPTAARANAAGLGVVQGGAKATPGAASRQNNPVKPAAPARPAPPLPPVAPTASPARLGSRHVMIAASFVLGVMLPILLSAWYLYARAVDQYASYVGFSVRSESAAAPGELLGGLGNMLGVSGNSTTDSDILYKFMTSHDLVSRVNQRLDLRAIWSKAPGDPVFGYHGDASLEDLRRNWERKVRVYFDNGMIDLRVLAFDPADAQAISQAIMDESTDMINDLNAVAREDTLRYARAEVEQAVERVKQARQDMNAFRNLHQMVDPAADVQMQSGIVASLQGQLAESLISLAMLKSNAQPNDPRVSQAELRIATIREQIEDERRKLGSSTSSGEVLSDVVGQYEGLLVDRQFAEQTYTATLAALDVAQAEARRQSRYLAAYVRPTLAQQAEYPERAKLLGIISGFLLLSWLIGVLIYYSLRDRR
ncbi:MAG: hypothetical protein Q4G22_14940 [Paracoccus sp. (in: a-proteobacteria)]|uniref:hypothetical protein n=1 Tax=Paracoccus sp. TaxID=267 RepID=UPI0026DFD20C|nr:hypothetical protein [Paracoccus sp. (in: a-proteobacteria)]MDO5633109.1 hypothetical protein [Paracoccus sp. (in: a-proteobacteria)]